MPKRREKKLAASAVREVTTSNYIDNLKSFHSEGMAGWSLSMSDSQRFSV
jgi:hypothetical protein